MSELWQQTEGRCESHQRWDFRFSEITYLPRSDESETQEFRYATRIGFGKAIRGWGRTAGEKVGAARTSALEFGSDDPLSLIAEGSGYWKYEPVVMASGSSQGTTTTYAWVRARSACGRVAVPAADRRATAWSFDRLRLWIEQGIDPPEQSARQASVHLIATARRRWSSPGSGMARPEAPGAPRRRSRDDAHDGWFCRRLAVPTVVLALGALEVLAFGWLRFATSRRAWAAVARRRSAHGSSRRSEWSVNSPSVALGAPSIRRSQVAVAALPSRLPGLVLPERPRPCIEVLATPAEKN